MRRKKNKEEASKWRTRPKMMVRKAVNMRSGNLTLEISVLLSSASEEGHHGSSLV